MSDRAKLVKLADKICNVRDMQDNPPPHWETGRRQAYFDWASQVVEGLRGANVALERSFDRACEDGRLSAPDSAGIISARTGLQSGASVPARAHRSVWLPITRNIA